MIRFIILVPHMIISTTLCLLTLCLSGIFNPYSQFNNNLFYYWSKLILFNAGVKLNITGLENIDRSHGYILTSNHTHLLDIPVLCVASKLGLRFAAKKELFNIPVFGQALALIGMVKIDRGKTQNALKNLKKIETKINQGVTLAIFPEGTRNRKGKEMLPFKKGAFMMSINTHQPLLPVSVNKSNTILQGFKLIPGQIDVHFHPPIDPAHYGLEKRKEFMDITRTVIESKREYDDKNHS